MHPNEYAIPADETMLVEEAWGNRAIFRTHRMRLMQSEFFVVVTATTPDTYVVSGRLRGAGVGQCTVSKSILRPRSREYVRRSGHGPDDPIGVRQDETREVDNAKKIASA